MDFHETRYECCAIGDHTDLVLSRPGLDSRQRQRIFHVTASYPMGNGGLFPGVKRGRGVTLTTHTHLVLR
jgi:hypothetical protein